MSNTDRYYVVWEGRQCGIFQSWGECQDQVHRFPGARFKTFFGYDEALAALNDGPTYRALAVIPPKEVVVPQVPVGSANSPIPDSYCVDTSCSGNPGSLEYRGLHFATGRELFRRGPFARATNNAGEFLAIVSALALLQNNQPKTPVYSESQCAISWVTQKRCNCNVSGNLELERLVRRAEQWLQRSEFQNPILKWQTQIWGKNPADFGRK